MKKVISPKKKEKKSKRLEEQKKEIKIEEIIREAEKEIKSGGIEDFNFQEFPEELEFEEGSPSLGRINSSSRTIINLEEDLAQNAAPVTTEEKDNDAFKYSFGGGNTGEPKYIQYENAGASEMLKRTEIENFGKANLFERREVGFTESAEARPTDTNFERYDPVKRMEREELGKRDNLLPKRELKYTPSR